MIYSPTEFDGRRQRRTTDRLGDELFEFQATFNPIDEPDRKAVEDRIVLDVREKLGKELERHYKRSEGHTSR